MKIGIVGARPALTGQCASARRLGYRITLPGVA